MTKTFRMGHRKSRKPEMIQGGQSKPMINASRAEIFIQRGGTRRTIKVTWRAQAEGQRERDIYVYRERGGKERQTERQREREIESEREREKEKRNKR